MTRSFFSKTILTILFLQIFVSLGFVFFRTMDADEGFYLAAAQRAADGLALYDEFFFPQMPLQPLVFAPLSGWGYSSLFLLRIISMLCGVLLTLVMYRLVKENAKDDRLAAVAAFLTAFSGLFLTWHSTFKPYAFVDLFLLLSFLYLQRIRISDKGAVKNIFLTMLTLALAINFRSIFIVILPFYLFQIFGDIKSRKQSIVKAYVAAFAGLLIPSIPAIYLFFQSSANFWFDNLIFHLNREPIEPFSALLLHKLTVVGKFLALPQTVLLVVAAGAAHFLVRAKLTMELPIARQGAMMALLIGAVYLLPTPMLLQYFQQTIPFLICAALPAIALIKQYDAKGALLRTAAIAYLAGILPFIFLFILYPREPDQRFEWEQLCTVVAQIDKHSAKSDTILSEWAGYAALAQRRQLPGSEHVGFHFPLEISEERYRDYHLLTNAAIVEALNQRRPELVVIDYRVYPEWEPALFANYHLADSSGKTFIYKKNNES